jgi:hypothetical protein
VHATGSVTLHVNAAPEDVYALLSDIGRMGEWSPECYRCEYVDGATGPVVGAKFKGSNKRGLVRWTTTAEIVAAEPARVFAFSTKAGGEDQTRWRYELTPSGLGTDVTESFESVKEPLYVRVFERVFWRDRAQQRETGMRTTLERVKRAAEATR